MPSNSSSQYSPIGKQHRGLSIVVLTLVIAMTLGASYGIMDMMERRAHSSAEKVVSQVVEHIDDKMAEVEKATWNAVWLVKKHLNEPDVLEQLVRDFVENTSFVYGSTVAFEPDIFPAKGRCFAPYSWKTPDGNVHSRQLGTETDYYEEEWYAETKKSGEEYWCEPYFDEGGAKITMCTFSIPIFTDNGELRAVMTSDVGLEDLEEYISSINPNPDTYIILHSRQGQALANAQMDATTGSNHIIIKSLTQIGWSVELVTTFTRLIRGDSGIFIIIGIILLITVLFVYFLNLMLNKLQQRASAEYLSVIEQQQVNLQEALMKAESASKAKTDFLFNMSHDIRTPMNAILGYTDVAIRHFDDKEKAMDSLKKIKSSSNHLLGLINDILEMSRVESGTLEITTQQTDIRDLIEKVDHMGQALATPKTITFKTVIGNLKNPYVYADELHYSQVIINLVSNAVKYTNEDGRVTYSVDQLGDPVNGRVTFRFEVSDNGIGMSEGFQDHLFDAFARERSSTVSRQQGAGLGLSIVKKIVDLSGGKIDVKSKLGEGTTMTVVIPLVVMNDQEIQEYKRLNNRSEDEVNGDFSFEGKKVLLVEDNELNREIAEMILTESGLIVETAEDGGDAVLKVKENGANHYDFILMDIQMPVMNGYEATKAIRELPGGESVPIIAVSANAFEEDKQKSLEARMNDHVAKPIDIGELFKAMRRLAK